jgi:hypothetical protein
MDSTRRAISGDTWHVMYFLMIEEIWLSEVRGPSCIFYKPLEGQQIIQLF